MCISATNVADKVGEESMKKYPSDNCARCKKRMYHYRHNSLCGKCYLITKQEDREKKGLK